MEKEENRGKQHWKNSLPSGPQKLSVICTARVGKKSRVLKDLGLKFLNVPNQMSIKCLPLVTSGCLCLPAKGCPLLYLATSWLQVSTSIFL